LLEDDLEADELFELADDGALAGAGW